MQCVSVERLVVSQSDHSGPMYSKMAAKKKRPATIQTTPTINFRGNDDHDWTSRDDIQRRHFSIAYPSLVLQTKKAII